MLDDFRLEATDICPKVVLSQQTNVFEISGNCLHEDPMYFFKPVIEWLNEYVKSPNSNTEFNFFLEYFNSSSAKEIAEILFTLEKITATGNKVKVNWHHLVEDDVMEERGNEFLEISNIPFELKSVN
ncbi:MAG: nuclear pore complex subunit [Flavobacteriales bacterium]|nr:MAG: nuclear pore complex subunit [Flavobacteriales bacterium]